MSNSEHSKQSVENGQQTALTSDLEQLSSKQVQRRRFLKASAVGAPLILTLRSGAALAAASATCDMKLAEANIPAPNAVVSEADGMSEDPSWVRAIGTKHTFTPTSNGETQEVIEVDGTLYVLDMNQLTPAPNQDQLMEWEQADGDVTTESVSVLVHFDNTHQMSVESVTGSPLTNSCWVSIQPSP
ncbi:hypothetical protein H0A36_23135 [Endozoicomonas sp. SM1973]|uniref:Uncharacterized protein n=1 Tax=Spartinivicinus marinus TaxID=2994442 RepID=A0A853IEF8_9GAMM|nr:hypothetical protein [Spartinivicinus marinus]MCX4025345.1 hypothetical protein [Spartinivicinus marinus]NYZ68918.1 hypothetical protein [Spartinivicinus marinus]